MIPRIQQTRIEEYLEPNKVVVIYGPRRAGKTTLVQNYLSITRLKYKLDSGNSLKVQNILSSQDIEAIREYLSEYKLYVLDEAQYVPNVGLGLKIIVDQIPGIRVIATGSSSFELSGQLGEPLTGRKWTIKLFPISQKELLSKLNPYELKDKLEEYLIFGSYPEVVTATSRKKKELILEEIVNSYLFKDVLALEGIKSSKTLVDLVKLLAFQIGSLVSLNELANQLNINVNTVERYLDLLEKTFIIVSHGGFRRNLRNEIRSKYKYYFVDIGIRNAIISLYNPLNLRNDIGQLWENFIFMERMKKRTYVPISAGTYFWRTYEGKEIDIVEMREGKLFGYEIKWGGKLKSKSQKEWLSTYKEGEFQIVNRDNYLKFIT